MRINWFSNAPWASTGYGNQTKLFVPRIKQLGYEMSITAFYGLQGGIIGWFDGTPVYPNGKHPYGQDVIGAHAVNAKADAIISLFDVWPMQPENIPQSIKWFPWFPVDSEPMPPAVLKNAMRAEKGITMSKFGKAQADLMGLDAYYVPHGVDTKVFKPRAQADARKYLSFPQDKFIVGTIAANNGVPPRKSWFELIAAFSALKKQHPDAMYYVHTDDGTRGGETVNIPQFCEVMGLTVGYFREYNAQPQDVDVLIVDQYSNMLGLPDDYMNAVYNALDVMMLVSLGEGFGIPIIEAQAAGCPVIVGDWTAMGELCFSGWKVAKDEATPEWNAYASAFQYKVTVPALVDRLLAAYNMAGNQEYREAARKGALAYDADRVTEKYWKPVLIDMEGRIND